MDHRHILLASGSPRRKELLEQIGVSFTVKVSDADERTDETEPSAMVEDLAKIKASGVWEQLSEEEKRETVVIGADTIVWADDRVLGKPKDETEAAEMLNLLSGKTHQVYTGVALISQSGVKSFYECTHVSVCTLTPQEISAYIATGDPMDKAGAYGIQGMFARYISGIRGDYNNVVGLPVCRLYQELKD